MNLEEFVSRGMAAQNAADEAIANALCRIPLPASSIGSICGRAYGHEGHHGDPIAATPSRPARRDTEGAQT